MILKKGVLYKLYIHSEIRYHQLVLPQRYHQNILTALYDPMDHQGIEHTLDLLREWVNWLSVVHTWKQTNHSCMLWIHKSKKNIAKVLITKLSIQRTRLAGSKDPTILIVNLVLIWDQPEGRNKIQDSNKEELFVMTRYHQFPKCIYISLNLQLKQVNRRQMFDVSITTTHWCLFCGILVSDDYY